MPYKHMTMDIKACILYSLDKRIFCGEIECSVCIIGIIRLHIILECDDIVMLRQKLEPSLVEGSRINYVTYQNSSA